MNIIMTAAPDTLDFAIEDFWDDPCFKTAERLARNAIDYYQDEMISEYELENLLDYAAVYLL